ncbi:hypothetical protein I7I53_01764 [Histoplasma capsulatum var. duboisii H88]|uniref:Uncharacterized protein n=1 Tax=Ajellomyces capsulatus (strain H88) TaxID=544711 RepID=A0A8A1LP93_AJEC8|nr:hypothetical protein I7I53_01764 [Histoplasma capsulatum var. duboisii H88]
MGRNCPCNNSSPRRPRKSPSACFGKNHAMQHACERSPVGSRSHITS